MRQVDGKMKKGVYHIKDNSCEFLVPFCVSHLSELYMTSPEQFYDAYIAHRELTNIWNAISRKSAWNM